MDADIADWVVILHALRQLETHGLRQRSFPLNLLPAIHHRDIIREIADQTVSPEDLKEELVHSLQKFVEVDEPEPDTVPLIGSAGASVDADDTEVAVERMTEEELLKGLEGLAPPEEQPEEDE